MSKIKPIHYPCRAMSAMPTFTFGEPLRCELQSLGKAYYLQNLTLDNGGLNVLITSDWFQSDGIKTGVNNKAEMMFKTSGIVRSYLNAIEASAIHQLKIPIDLVHEHGISNDIPAPSLYRALSQSEYLYAKLERDCPIFNMKRNIIKKEETGFGEYRILLHVKGLYIGSHSTPGKLASLQMRINQIQYKEASMTCLLEPMAGLCRIRMDSASMPLPMPASTPTPIATSTPTKAAPPTVVPSAPKKARQRQKPMLQRQNAISDSQIINQAFTQSSENGASDFFVEMDV